MSTSYLARNIGRHCLVSPSSISFSLPLLSLSLSPSLPHSHSLLVFVWYSSTENTIYFQTVLHMLTIYVISHPPKLIITISHTLKTSNQTKTPQFRLSCKINIELFYQLLTEHVHLIISFPNYLYNFLSKLINPYGHSAQTFLGNYRVY